jgi:hypothetical protein
MKIAVLLLAGGLLAATTASNPTKQEANAFQVKLLTIIGRGEVKAAAPRPTTVTQNEVNSYLHFKQTEILPVGVADASIAIYQQGRLGGRAIVDLDAVRQKKGSGGWFDPTSYLTGRLPVTATGTLQTRDGEGRFALESAAISGIPIPKSFLQELVSYYTRSTDYPNGVSLDDPFALPVGIRRIDTDAGKAVIVQ